MKPGNCGTSCWIVGAHLNPDKSGHVAERRVTGGTVFGWAAATPEVKGGSLEAQAPGSRAVPSGGGAGADRAVALLPHWDPVPKCSGRFAPTPEAAHGTTLALFPAPWLKLAGALA